MQSFFAVKNNTAFPVISVAIDGKRIFYDILKGDTSRFISLPSGSIAFTAYNNYERLFLDRWISVPPHKKLVLSVSEKGLFFI